MMRSFLKKITVDSRKDLTFLGNIFFSKTVEIRSTFDYDVNLLDIFWAIKAAWKVLVLATLIGVLLGLSNWIFLPSYKSEYVLNNSAPIFPGGLLNYGITFESWKQLQIKLPLLASEIVQKGRVPSGEEGCYRQLANRWWWDKNVTAEFYKKLDGSQMGLLRSLKFITIGPTKESSISCANTAIDFFRSSGIYLDLLSEFSGAEVDVNSKMDQIEKKLFNLKQDFLYENQSVKNYESLYKRLLVVHPELQRKGENSSLNNSNSHILKKILDKYIEIETLKESIEKTEVELKKISITRDLIKKTKPLFENILNGPALYDEIFLVVQDLRNAIDPNELDKIHTLDNFNSKLISVNQAYGSQLNIYSSYSVKQGSIANSIFLWTIATFGLVIIFIISRSFWLTLKLRLSQPVQENN